MMAISTTTATRFLGRGLATLTLLTLSLAGHSVIAPQAVALESIQLTYGDLEAPPISLNDLEEFAQTGIASRDLQLLFTLLRIDEVQARQLLTEEIPVEVESLRQISNSFVGQFFWRLVSTALSLSDSPGEAWQVIQAAVLEAAASGRLSILDVLRHVNAIVLRVDSQRVMALAEQIRPEDMAILSSIFLGL